MAEVPDWISVLFPGLGRQREGPPIFSSVTSMCGAEDSLLLCFPTLDGTLECAGEGGFPLCSPGTGGALLLLLFKVLTSFFVLSRRIQNLQKLQNKATSLAHLGQHNIHKSDLFSR